MSKFLVDIDRLATTDRINIIGTSGSGKSTLGRKLANLFDLPFFELDGVFWGPDWTETPDEDFFPKVEAITDTSRWVLDGNYTRTTPIKWRQVQLVVWLDMSPARTFFRVTSRCLRRSLDGSEIWPGTGNRETLGKAFFSRDSVILWSITSYRRNRNRYAQLMESDEYPHLWFVRLTSPGEVDQFLSAAEVAAKSRR